MDAKILRRLTLNDTTRIAKMANNKRIWDNLRDFIPYPYHEEDAIEYIALTLKEEPDQTFGVLNERNELCGVVSVFIQSDVYKQSGEIGYWIGEEHWDRGLATKAVKEITKYAFEQLKLQRIYAGVFEFNKSSMKVLEKNGFQKEGIFRKSVTKNGQLCDEHRYAIVKED